MFSDNNIPVSGAHHGDLVLAREGRNRTHDGRLFISVPTQKKRVYPGEKKVEPSDEDRQRFKKRPLRAITEGFRKRIGFASEGGGTAAAERREYRELAGDRGMKYYLGGTAGPQG